MRLGSFLFCVLAWSWSAAAAADVKVSVDFVFLDDGGSPIPVPMYQGRPIARDLLAFNLSVQSTYEIAKLEVTLDDAALNMPEGGWKEGVDIHALARGFKRLHVSATDALGAKDETEVEIFHDNPPKLTLTLGSGSIVRGPYQASVTCEDDDPTGCASLALSNNDHHVEAQDATQPLFATFVPAEGWDDVNAQAVDSTGGRALVHRRVYELPSPRLELIADGNDGTLAQETQVRDFADSRLLLAGYGAEERDRALYILNYELGSHEKIPAFDMISAQLTSQGLAWREDPPNAPCDTGESQLWLYAAGESQASACRYNLQLVRGYATWLEKSADYTWSSVLLNLETAEETHGSTWPGSYSYGPQILLLGNGDVLAQTSAGPDEPTKLQRMHGGVIDDVGPYSGMVVSDGSVIAVARGSRLTLIDELGSPTELEVSGLGTLLVNAGIVAYDAIDALGHRQVWHSEKASGLTQRTFFNGDSTLQGVTSEGRLIVSLAPHDLVARTRCGSLGQRGIYFVAEPTDPRFVLQQDAANVLIHGADIFVAVDGALLKYVPDNPPCEDLPDAGMSDVDGGSPFLDAGRARVDAGVATDGTAMNDAATMPAASDAAVPAADAGSSLDAGHARQHDHGSCSTVLGSRSAPASLAVLFSLLTLAGRRRSMRTQRRANGSAS
jgi:hypothetical protein